MLNFISTRGIMLAWDDFFNSFISCLQRPAILITRGVSFSGFVINRWNSFTTMIDRYRETVNPSLERLPRSSGRKILSYFPSKFSTNSSIMSAQAWSSSLRCWAYSALLWTARTPFCSCAKHFSITSLLNLFRYLDFFIARGCELLLEISVAFMKKKDWKSSSWLQSFSALFKLVQVLELFPFNRGRRLTADIVTNTVDTAYFIDDTIGNLTQ